MASKAFRMNELQSTACRSLGMNELQTTGGGGTLFCNLFPALGLLRGAIAASARDVVLVLRVDDPQVPGKPELGLVELVHAADILGLGLRKGRLRLYHRQIIVH